MPSHRTIGESGERCAVSFLERRGFIVLDRNYVHNHGEIDIVAKDGDEIVFVEVKFRRSLHFGSPEEAVTPAKQELLRRTAEGYVAERGLTDVDCRFDVIAISTAAGEKRLKYFRNAF